VRKSVISIINHSVFILLAATLISGFASAQSADQTPAQSPPHQHHHTNPTKPKPDAQPQAEPQPEPDTNHAHHHADAAGSMMSTVTGGPFRSMNALGSGTALQPASTPVSGWHFMPGEWMVMLHGELKIGYNHQGGPRGVGKAESQNWLMLMAERNLGRGRLMLRGMVTAEPLTTPHGGFPQLFQTGETYRRIPIVDAQHPHDLVMELAASYTIPISEKISFQLYGGPVGEPALGPVAFMHRASAMENPSVPLGHHWQDSSHITHGVVTGALTVGRFRFEGSGFHGREPDENRAAIELGRIDSYSFRVGFLPTPNWAMQFSYGHLDTPEALTTSDVIRHTASITWNRPLRSGNIASALVWGRNSEVHGVSNSYLLESTVNFLRKNHAYFRGELLDKQGLYEDNIFGRLGLVCVRVKPPKPLEAAGQVSDPSIINIGTPPGTIVCQPGNPATTTPTAVAYTGPIVTHPDPPPSTPTRAYPREVYNRWFRVGAFTVGGVRDLIANDKLRVGIGADVTFYHQPSVLDPIYGRGTKSYQVFLRFRPGEMK